MQGLNKTSLLIALRAQLCRSSFFEFVKYFWPTIINEEPIWNWHIEYLCNELQEVGERVKARQKCPFDYFIINIPPGSSKTTIATICYPVWCWTIDPTQRFICSSYAADIAEDSASKARRLMNSTQFKDLFPELVLFKDNVSHFENSFGGERYTTSTSGSVTGKHAHQIIVDDPQNVKKAESEKERKTAIEHVTKTLSTRKVNKAVTPIIIIMQRLHQSDVTGRLLALEKARVKHICLPAEVSGDVKPESLTRHYKNGLLDPVRMPKETLANEKTNLGSYSYAGQYGQRPAPAEGGIFKKAWFEVVDKVRPPGAVVHFRVDTAYDEKNLKNNDPSAVMAYYKEANDIYILDCQSVYLEFPELITFLTTYVQNFGYSVRSRLKIEPKASGKSVVQQLRKGTNLNVSEDRSPKDSKLIRAQATTAKCESLRVKLHRGAWNVDFLDEIAAFPNASHDDKVDVLTATIHEELLGETWALKRAN